MSNATVSRLGANQAGADPFALFLKVFGGEVLTAFQKKVIMKELTRFRAVSNTRSTQFPVIYKADSAAYHVPGTEIVGSAIEHTEVNLVVDDLLISDVFIALIDEAMNHYDVRAPYSDAIGNDLGEQYDANLSRTLWQATGAAALFSTDQGGERGTFSNSKTDALQLAKGIWTGLEALDTKDVDVDAKQVNAVLKPAQWYLLAQEPTLVLNSDVGGDGSYSKGTFNMIGGVHVKKSNNLRWGSNDTATGTPSDPNKYDADMTEAAGAVFTEDAVATVQLLGLGIESDYDIRRQGTLMVGKYSVGHGVMLPKTAYGIVDDI